jgi:hypothetical protein
LVKTEFFSGVTLSGQPSIDFRGIPFLLSELHPLKETIWNSEGTEESMAGFNLVKLMGELVGKTSSVDPHCVTHYRLFHDLAVIVPCCLKIEVGM